MSALFDRLTFVLAKKNLNQISIESGIPYSTLWNYARGKANLPDKWETSLINTYNRQTYANMRDVGFSSIQANRFRWYSPTKVVTLEIKAREVLLQYTNYAIGQKAARENTMVTQKFIDDNFSKMYADIKSKFGKSRITYEEYIKYGDNTVG